MRTPVLLVAGQGDTDGAVTALLRAEGTFVVRHRFDGHVVERSVTNLRNGTPVTTESVLELCHGCISCTIRNDLLKLLRRMHRWKDVDRVVVHLAPWLEPQPICWAINHVKVLLGPGFIDGPAARDVQIAAVVSCLDTWDWLEQALGDQELDDGRTRAQVAVGQAEFADVIVVDHIDKATMSVLSRLAPRASVVHDPRRVGGAVAKLGEDARRGRSDDPLGPLLIGQPPLDFDGEVGIVEFGADRPFHPERLHEALDVLLSGVVRTRGRIWLANHPSNVMCLESAGGGLRVNSGGKWLAAMTDSEIANVDEQRRVLAGLTWDTRYGDRHTSLVALACGAVAEDIRRELQAALLTDAEMAYPDQWRHFADPFGDWHKDPCVDSPNTAMYAPNAEHGYEQ
ncbi:ribosome hibernation factor-recruiting GTPase MRF [Mycobacterium attenuatum]|uniref:ribosome hibernation factor-recruiting GTPase MRF n=1 Tax=Mycobacterium attenuatum TaxID=2341086 RepID=UPI000F01DA07|nr:GTP-binding protein [Mycobacterium attenuatum]VBA45381.1 Putative metal chaperone YciC [Mycobacterium attenuatum]